MLDNRNREQQTRHSWSNNTWGMYVRTFVANLNLRTPQIQCHVQWMYINHCSVYFFVLHMGILNLLFFENPPQFTSAAEDDSIFGQLNFLDESVNCYANLMKWKSRSGLPSLKTRRTWVPNLFPWWWVANWDSITETNPATYCTHSSLCQHGCRAARVANSARIPDLGVVRTTINQLRELNINHSQIVKMMGFACWSVISLTAAWPLSYTVIT